MIEEVISPPKEVAFKVSEVEKKDESSKDNLELAKYVSFSKKAAQPSMSTCVNYF